MGKCLTILTFNNTRTSWNGEKYKERQHLGLALIKPSKESDEIINLMRVGYPANTLKRFMVSIVS